MAALRWRYMSSFDPKLIEMARRALGQSPAQKPTIPFPFNPPTFLPPIPQKVSTSMFPLKKTVFKIVDKKTAFKNGIRKEISDIINGGINQTFARVLPTVDSLGFGEGKMVETAVLYIDIRSSSDITAFHTSKEAAKIYMCFHRAMVKTGKWFGGQIAGFAGDRIMIVFPVNEEHKYQRSNAVKTAILMRQILDEDLNPLLSQKFNHPLNCGIGVDFGGMLVVKAGAYGPGNNDLIWSGDPANFASKLADDKRNEGIYITSEVHDRMDKSLKEDYIWIEVFPKMDRDFYTYVCPT